MPNTRVLLSDDLRDLIRLTRTDVARTTQRGAALLANISDAWWRQIETGVKDYATADTLARMSYAIGVTPDQLRNIGQTRVAELVERRLELLEPEPEPEGSDMDEYLMATPDLDDAQRRILVSLAHALLTSELPRWQASPRTG